MDERFIDFLYRRTLEEVFMTKEKMSKNIEVHLRTLQHVFEKLDHQKGASMATVHLFLWLLQQEISVDCLYKQFAEDLDKKGILMRMTLMCILLVYPLYRRKRIGKSRGMG